MTEQEPDVLADEALAQGETDTKPWLEFDGTEQAVDWLRRQSVAVLHRLADAAVTGMRGVDPDLPPLVAARAREVLLAEAAAEISRLL